MEFRLKLIRKLAKTWIKNDYKTFNQLIDLVLNSAEYTKEEKEYISNKVNNPLRVKRFETSIFNEVLVCY